MNNNYDYDFNFNKSWKKGDGEYLNKDIYYLKEFMEETNKIINKCIDSGKKMKNVENGELICDSDNMKNKDSILIKYLDKASTIAGYFSDEITALHRFLEDKRHTNKSYYIEKNITMKKLDNISNDLSNYEKDFLDKVDYYIDVSKICGFILSIIFYTILLVVTLACSFLLWAYTYFKEQKLLSQLMHIFWNILNFFSFSFFIFGTGFGVLYYLSRDLIGYNKFLFNENLAENATTYLLPNKKAKEFLRFCINSENTNYLNKLEGEIINLFLDLDKNMKGMKNTFELYRPNNFSEFKQSIQYFEIDSKLRNVQEIEEESDTSIIVDILDFSPTGNAFQKMIEMMTSILFDNKKKLRYLQSNNNITKDIEEIGNYLSVFDCGFLKSEIQILYDTLYELSIESRISCAICCCIGFFAEIAIIFYLLVMYHYNHKIFNDEDEPHEFTKIIKRKFDQESQNEFMDKSRPVNMKENNKKLDLEFGLN